MKTYRVICLISDVLKGKDLEKTIANIHKSLKNIGCQNVVTKNSRSAKLAYQIKKNDLANFVNIVFDIDPEKVLEINQKLKTMPAVLRFKILGVKKIKLLGKSKQQLKIKPIFKQPADPDIVREKIESIKKSEKNLVISRDNDEKSHLPNSDGIPASPAGGLTSSRQNVGIPQDDNYVQKDETFNNKQAAKKAIKPKTIEKPMKKVPTTSEVVSESRSAPIQNDRSSDRSVGKEIGKIKKSEPKISAEIGSEEERIKKLDETLEDLLKE